VLDAMFSLQKPTTGTDGTLCWNVDISSSARREGRSASCRQRDPPERECLDPSASRVWRADRA
jgi:hypothetical protein